MGQLSDLIAQAKANEIAQAQDALAQQLDTIAGAHEFAEKYFGPLTDPEHKRRAASRLEPFTLWCTAKGVPALPARSTTVAAWIISETDRGVDEKQIRGTLSEIELAHEVLGLNPVATFWVRFALSKMSGAIEAPRSWNKSEKAMFTGLPFEAQQVIARREQDRETTLRRAQNEAAELRRLMANAEKSADNTTTEKENEMAKKEGWEKGVGPYSGNDVKMTQQPDKGYPKPVDISKRVDPAADQDGGFSGKLPSGE